MGVWLEWAESQSKFGWTDMWAGSMHMPMWGSLDYGTTRMDSIDAQLDALESTRPAGVQALMREDSQNQMHGQQLLEKAAVHKMEILITHSPEDYDALQQQSNSEMTEAVGYEFSGSAAGRNIEKIHEKAQP